MFTSVQSVARCSNHLTLLRCDPLFLDTAQALSETGGFSRSPAFGPSDPPAAPLQDELGRDSWVLDVPLEDASGFGAASAGSAAAAAGAAGANGASASASLGDSWMADVSDATGFGGGVKQEAQQAKKQPPKKMDSDSAELDGFGF